MAANLNNEKLIAQYLLGELPEEQQVEIEDRAFADKEYLASITAVENDLIDEYVRNELSQTQRQRFESRFLASAERRVCEGACRRDVSSARRRNSAPARGCFASGFVARVA
jgi:anti-sigma factor RsiW